MTWPIIGTAAQVQGRQHEMHGPRSLLTHVFPKLPLDTWPPTLTNLGPPTTKNAQHTRGARPTQSGAAFVLCRGQGRRRASQGTHHLRKDPSPGVDTQVMVVWFAVTVQVVGMMIGGDPDQNPEAVALVPRKHTPRGQRTRTHSQAHQR